MKLVILFFIIFYATSKHYGAAVDTQLVESEILLPYGLVDKLKLLQRNYEQERYQEISTLIDDLADQIFANIQVIIRKKGANFIKLEDIELKKGIIKMDLKNGNLKNIDSLSRRSDVEVEYSHKNKKLTLIAPLQLQELECDFDFETRISLISVVGTVVAIVNVVNINVQLSFDFKNMTAILDSYDMKDSGPISVKFTGNHFLDVIVNYMSKVVTAVIGPLVIGKVTNIIDGGLNDVIEKINEIFQNLAPNNQY